MYFSSIALGFYLFLEVVINDYEISSEDWVGAKRAGERLVHLELSSDDKARIWCELSAIYGEHFKDFKAARQGYERALREEEDY